MSARSVEAASVVVIAIAILLGGNYLLVTIARFNPLSALALLALAVSLTFAMVRSLRAGGPLVRLRASRDIAFLAGILTALAFVLHPARWALGAAIAGVEFGLVLELLARFAPSPQSDP